MKRGRNDNPSLEGAVRKLALIGEQAGLTPDDLIRLLDSGMSVAQLVEYLMAKQSERAVES